MFCRGYKKVVFSLLALVIAVLILFPSVALSSWDDVTDSVMLIRTRPLYNYVAKIAYFDGSLTNTSGQFFQAPIRVVIDSVTTPLVTVHNADGTTDDGKPYFDFSAQLGDGKLDPGETSSAIQIEFYNPNRFRFNFTWKILVEAGAAPPENHLPTAIPGGPYSGVTGQEIAFDCSGSSDPDNDPLTYAWDFGDGVSGTGSNPGHIYTTAGTFDVSLTVSDGKGGSHTGVTQATIFVQPSVTLSVEPETIQAGESSTLTWTSTNADSAAIDNGIGNVAVSGTTSVSPADTTTYTISVTGQGGLAAAGVTITVNHPPVANAGGPYSGSTGQEITFDGSGSFDPDNDPLTYVWDFGDGMSGTGSNPGHIYATAGAFDVSLTVSDGKGGSHTGVTQATIFAQPSVTLSAEPETIQAGESSTLTWASTNADSATIDNGIGNVAVSGTTSVSPTDTTTYTISVTGQGGIATANVTITVNHPPVANAGGPYSGRAGQEIIFNGSGSSDPDNDPLTYAWDFGDGVSGTGSNPGHIYTTAGTFDVSLTVSDGKGGSHTGVTQATIFVQPSVTLSAEPETIQAGESSTLTWTSTNADSAAIDNGIGNVAVSGTTSISPADTTTYTISVTGQGGLAAAGVTITVNHPPVANAGGPYSGSTGQEIIFNGSGSSDPDNDPLTYAWDFGDGVSGTGSNPGHIYATAGAFDVSLTVSDGKGGSHTGVTQATIFAQPSVTLSAEPETIQAGESSTLTWASTNADSATIDNGIENVAVSGTASVSPADTTTYTISVTGQGGLAAAGVTITVNHPPVANAGGPYSGITGQEIAFDGSESSDPDNDLLTFEWNFGDGTTAEGSTPTHSYAEAGNYTVTLTVSDGRGGSNMAQVQVTVTQANRPPTMEPIADQAISENEPLTFNVVGSDPDGDTLTYTASGLPAGASFDPATRMFSWTPTYEQSTVEPYTVGFTVTDTGGLSASIEVRITVTDFNRPPLLDLIDNQSVDENSPLTLQLNGSDPDQDPLTYGANNLPPGATVALNTGFFSWTPTFDQAGSYNVTFSISDGKISAEQQVLIEVIDVNRAPSIITTNIPNCRVDQIYKTQIVAEDPDGDTIEYSIETTTQVTIHSVIGQLFWDKPSISDIGVYSLTVRVEDGRGGSDTRQYNLSVPDTIPPAITLNIIKQANPGITINVEAKASDNDAVVAVEVYEERIDFSPPYQNIIMQQKQITLPSELGTVTVHAFAWDPSGNKGEAIASIEVVATFDTTPPQISLNAPSQVAPEQVITLTALVSDDVGVSTVTFSADGTDIGTTPAQHPFIEYQIPSDAIIGSTIQFKATAVDFSMNSSFDEATSTVVDAGQADTTPPDPQMQTPEIVPEDETIPLIVTPNEECLAQIDVYVNHTLAATYFAPDTQNLNFNVPMPDGVEGGMNALVEVVVTDCSGNQTTTSNWINVEEPGKGIVAGEVYNDRTGLPLADAEVSFVHDDGFTLSAITDARGQYYFVSNAGTGWLTVTKDGFTQVVRAAVAVPEKSGLEVFDARLTPLEATMTSVSAVLGGELITSFLVITAGFVPAMESNGLDLSAIASTNITFDIPSGAITEDHMFTLTQVSPQGLADLLPGGWSPVGVIDINPRGISFQTPANLTVPNPLDFEAGDGIILATWDETEHAWRVVSSADMSADGTIISAQISFTGQFAFILPDVSPQAPPDPLAGELLQGLSPLLIPEQAGTTISPEPKIIFYKPGVHSDVGVSVSSLPNPIPSGAPVLVNIAEEYNFYSGERIVSDPYVQDIVLYSLNRLDLTAAFPVTPSYTFEALALNHGVIKVDVLAPTDAERGINVIIPEGGTVALPTGEAVILPEGAASDIIPVDLKALTEDGLGIEMPPEMTFVGGVMLSFSGSEFDEPLGLSVSVPAGFDEALGQLLLVQLLEVQGATRMALAGVGEVRGSNVISLYILPGSDDILLEGVLSEGRYIFVQMQTEIGFVSGTVFDAAGVSLDCAIVSTDAMPVIAISRGDGAYVQGVNTGFFSVMALDPEKMDRGTATGIITQAGDLVQLDISLVEEPPTVFSFSPGDGQLNVPLETAVKVTFSEPLDPATVTTDNLTLAGPEGFVAGTLTLSTGNAVVSFRSTKPLFSNTTYTFTASQGIMDLAGYALEHVFSFSFTSLDTIPPPPPPAGSITATIPDATSSSTITATQGTAGTHDMVSVINKTKGTSTPILVEADGSFSVNIDADIMDEVLISITDPAGNETVVPVGRFEGPDGSAVIGPDGGFLEADNGVILEIPAGAFPYGAIVRITGLTESDIGVDPGPDFPFVAGFEIECSVEPEIYLNASATLQSGTSPDVRGIVARVVEAYGEPALAIVDTAKVIDGRLATSSPPCPGLDAIIGRYAMFLNEHTSMAMGAALVSILAPGMHSTTIEAFIEAYPGSYEQLYPFIGKPEPGYAGQAFSEIYQQICMVVPPDEPLKVIIRDAETGELVDVVDIEPVPAGEYADIIYKDATDKTAPTLAGTTSAHGSLNPINRNIKVRFSEPVSPESLNAVHIIAEEDSEKIYEGTWDLRDNNCLLVFAPGRPLPMGKKYRLNLEGIKDIAGNAYQGPPVRFSTFKPYVIFPSVSNRLDRNRMANDLNVDPERIPQDLWFVDVDFVTYPSYVNMAPEEEKGSRWQTDIFAIQAQEGYCGDYRLFAIDAYDPTAPKIAGAVQTDSWFLQQRLHVIKGVHIQPRPDASGDPQFWKTRELHYVVDDPSVRICAEPGSPKLAFWRTRNCENPGDCDVLYCGCGDLAVTTVDNTKYGYLWSYDVTDLNDQKWVSSRLINDNGVSHGNFRQYEAPAGMGTPFGLTVVPGLDITHGSLVNENTVGAYVANYGIGLELVDLGLNVPTINDVDREPGSADEWAKAEALRINVQLYYRDVAVLRDKVIAIAGDIGQGTGIRSLEIFRPDLSGEPSGMVQLPNLPKRLATVTDFPIYDEDTQVPELYDLAFVTGEDGGVSVAEIPVGGGNPYLVSLIPTPPGVVTKDIQIDREARVAYVAALGAVEGVSGDHLLVVDVSKPFDRSADIDEDGWDDRIIGKMPLTIPGYTGPVYLHGFRLDPVRGLIYAGLYAGGKQGLAIIKIRECDDLGVDFKANPKKPSMSTGVEKMALQKIITQGIALSTVPSTSVTIIAHGSRSCLWAGGCESEYKPGKVRHEFVVLIPDSLWNNRDSLIGELYAQLSDDQGNPKPIEVMGYEVTFEDIEFLPMVKESFEGALLNLDQVQGDLGIARQALLLEWLVEGAYVDAEGLDIDSRPLAQILNRLKTPVVEEGTDGEVVETEPSQIWRLEGYELARLQEAEVLESGVLIRILGAAEPGTTIHQIFKKDLKSVASAAIKTALARIIANTDGNRLVAQGAGNIHEGFSFDSFEQYIMKVVEQTVQGNLGIFTPAEIQNIITPSSMLIDGNSSISTEEEANQFIAAALQFIREAGSNSGEAWNIYASTIGIAPGQAVRNANLTATEQKITNLELGGTKKIVPRIFNEGPQEIADVFVRMYAPDTNSGVTTEISNKSITVRAHSDMLLDTRDFYLTGIPQTDTGQNGWISFIVGLPERKVPEPDRDNNWAKLFYYVLDFNNPSVPPLPSAPNLPVDDPKGDLIEGDPVCDCKKPEFNIIMSVAGTGATESLSLSPGECVDVDVQVTNLTDQTLQDIHLFSNMDGPVSVDTLPANATRHLSFQYCIGSEQKAIELYVMAELEDENARTWDYQSNPIEIDVSCEIRAVAATANGEKELMADVDEVIIFRADVVAEDTSSLLYFWDLGDGTIRTEQNPTHTYTEEGEYLAKVIVKSDTCQATGNALVSLNPVDLDVDSDNDNGFAIPEFDAHEDKIEDIQNLAERAAYEEVAAYPFPLGKVIEINKGDADDDGVPDYADGFDLNTSDARDDICTDHPGFVPMRLKVNPSPKLKDKLSDLSLLRFTFDYYASEPDAMTLDEDVYKLPATGALRIWTKDANDSRNEDEINSGGSFVNTGVEYTPQALGINSPDNLETILYIEAVGRGRGKHEKVGVRLSILEDGIWESPYADEFIVDIFSAEFVECAEGPEKFPYKDILAVCSPRPIVTIDDAAVNPVAAGVNTQITVTGTVKTFIAPIEDNNANPPGKVFVNGEAVPINAVGLNDEEANGIDGQGPFVRKFSKTLNIGENHTLGAVVQAVNIVENMGYDTITFTPNRDGTGAITGWTKIVHDSNPKDDSEALPGKIEDYQFRIELISSLENDELELKINTNSDPDKSIIAKRVADTNRFLSNHLLLFPAKVGNQDITIPATCSDKIKDTLIRVSNRFEDTPEPRATYKFELTPYSETSYEDNSSVPVIQILVRDDLDLGVTFLEENPGHIATPNLELRSPKRWLTQKNTLYFAVKNLNLGKDDKDEIKLTVTSQTDKTGQEITLVEQSENDGFYLFKQDTDCIKIDGADAILSGKEIKVNEEELLHQFLKLGRENMGHIDPGAQAFAEDPVRSLVNSIMIDKGEFLGGGIYFFYLYSGNGKTYKPDGTTIDTYYTFPVDPPIAGCDRERLLAEAGTNTNLWQIANSAFPDNIGTTFPPNGLNNFIKDCGQLNNEGDYMHISSHGDYDGHLVDHLSPAGNDNIILPNNPRIEGAVINQTDWNSDTDWVFLATCNQLNNTLAKANPTGAQNWQGSLFGWPRHAHGILGSCEPMDGSITNMIDTFWHELRSGKTFWESYITGCNSIAHEYAILCHAKNKNDKLYDFTPDLLEKGGLPRTLEHVQKIGATDGVLREKFEDGEFELWGKPFKMPRKKSTFSFQLGKKIYFDTGIGTPVFETSDGVVIHEIGEFSLDKKSSLTDEKASAKALTFLTKEMAISLDELSSPEINQVAGSFLDKDLNVFDSKCVGYEITFNRIFDSLTIPDQFVHVSICGDDIYKVFVRWHELNPINNLTLISEEKHPRKILKRRLRRLRKILRSGKKRRFKIIKCDLSYVNAGRWNKELAGIYHPVCRISGIINRKSGKVKATVFFDIATETLLHSEQHILRGGGIGLDDLTRKTVIDVITTDSDSPERLHFAKGDLNGDYKSDLAVIKKGRKSIGLYIGDGIGGWIEKDVILFEELIGAVCIDQGLLYVGADSYLPEGTPVAVYVLKLPDNESKFIKTKLTLKKLEENLAAINSLSIRNLAGKTFMAVSGDAKRKLGLEHTTNFYINRDNNWTNVPLDSRCTISGKAVFADINGDEKIDILVSGLRRRSMRHKGSKGECGTEIFFQQNGSFLKTDKPGCYKNFCVLRTGGRSRIFSLSKNIMEFSVVEGWVKVGTLKGFELLAVQEEEQIYCNQQLVLRKAEENYEIGIFNCNSFKFSSVMQFSFDRDLFPILAFTSQNKGCSKDNVGKVILVSYDKKNNCFLESKP